MHHLKNLVLVLVLLASWQGAACATDATLTENAFFDGNPSTKFSALLPGSAGALWSLGNIIPPPNFEVSDHEFCADATHGGALDAAPSGIFSSSGDTVSWQYHQGSKFTQTSNLPQPLEMSSTRVGHSATLLQNGKVLFLGGGSGNANQSYDPATNGWAGVQTSLDLSYHGASVMNDGQVLVTGGLVNGASTKGAKLYNPTLDSWSDVAPMNTARREHTSTLLSDGTVLVAGGSAAPTGLIGKWSGNGDALDSSGNGNNGVVTGGVTYGPDHLGNPSRAFSFDGGSASFISTPNPLAGITGSFTMAFWAKPSVAARMPAEYITGEQYGISGQQYAIFPQIGATGATAGAGVSVSTSGVTVFEHSGGYLEASLTYAKALSDWTHVVIVYENNVARLYLNGAKVRQSVKSPKIVSPSAAFGGFSGNNYGPYKGMLDEVKIYNRVLGDDEIAGVYAGTENQSLNSSELFDKANNSWSTVGALNSARAGAVAVQLKDANHSVLVAGGSDLNGDPLKSAELYSPSTKSWTPAASGMTRARYAASLAVSGNGTALVLGGYDGSGGPGLTSVETVDTATGSWNGSVAQSLVTGRYQAAATALQDGKVLVTGGVTANPGPALLPSGLIGRWSVDGNLTDLSGSADNGSPTGTVSYGAGLSGQALSFDGTLGHYVTTPKSLTAVTGNFTMAFWAKPNATIADTPTESIGNSQAIANQRYAMFPTVGSSTTTAGAGVSVGTNGVRVVEHSGDYIPTTLAYVGALSSTVWTHVAVVYQNNRPSLYLNGVFVRQGVQSSRSVSPSAEFGGDVRTYGPYGGLLDEVEIFNRSLATDEIAQLATLPNQPSGLIGRWTADGNPNEVYNRNNGTVNGFVGYETGRFGQAFSFPGTDAATNFISYGKALTGVTGNFSMVFWANPGAAITQTTEQLSSGSIPSGQQYALYPLQADYVGAPAGSAGAGVSVGSNGISVFEHSSTFITSPLVYPVTLSGWTQVAVVYENSRPRLYLNGVMVRQGLVTGKTVFPTTQFGGGPFLAGPYKGQLDDIQIFGRALDADEIMSGYTAGSSRAELYGTDQPVPQVAGVGTYNYNQQAVLPGYTPALRTALSTGTKWLAATENSLTANPLTDPDGKAQWMATGWSGGSGRVPASGSSASVTLGSGNSDSTIKWNYLKNYPTSIKVTSTDTLGTAQAKLMKTIAFDSALPAATLISRSAPAPQAGNAKLFDSSATYWTPVNASSFSIDDSFSGDFPDDLWALDRPQPDLIGKDANGRYTVTQTAQSAPAAFNLSYTRRLKVAVGSANLDGTSMPSNSPGFTPAAGTVQLIRVGDPDSSFSAPNLIYAGKNTVRYVLTGWSGTGSVGSGDASPGAFTTVTPAVATGSTLTWNYKKQVRVSVSTAGETNPLKFYDLNVGTTAGSKTTGALTASPTAVLVGMAVVGYGVPDGTTVASVDTGGNTLTLSAAVTQSYSKEEGQWLTLRSLPAAKSADPRECPTSDASSVAACVASANATPAGAAQSGIGYYDIGAEVSLTAVNQFSESDSGNQQVTRTLTQAIATGGGVGGNVQQIIDKRKVLTAYLLSQPLNVDWRYNDTTAYPVGAPIEPVADWDGQKPTITEFVPDPAIPGDSADKAFIWAYDNTDKLHARPKYFPIHPVTSFKITMNYTGPTPGSSAVTARSPWPASPQQHIAQTPANLQPKGAANVFNAISYTTNSADASLAIFSAKSAGYSVLRFDTPAVADVNNNNPGASFKVVQTVALDLADAALKPKDWQIGSKITDASHQDPEGKTGYLYFAGGVYDGVGDDRAYDRATRSGAIIPVNVSVTGDLNPLVVVWYETDASRIGWPTTPKRYNPVWDAPAPFVQRVSISTGIGTKLAEDSTHTKFRVYNQPDSTQPGCNPNEEHALVDNGTLYALRDDLNAIGNLSQANVLLKYFNPQTGEWMMTVYQVAHTDSFTVMAEAGQPVDSPVPVSLRYYLKGGIKLQGGAEVGGEWFLLDRKGGTWAKAANWAWAKPDKWDGVPPTSLPDNYSHFVMQWYYTMRPDFFWPATVGLSPRKAGDPVPFLSSDRNGFSDSTAPIDVSYVTYWPAKNPPTLQAGDTLTTARDSLPDLYSFKGAEVVFDENVYKGGGPLAKLYAPERSLYAPLAALPTDHPGPLLPTLETAPGAGGLLNFINLPFGLQARLFYDGTQLGFKGAWISAEGGPAAGPREVGAWLLPNLMTAQDRDYLKSLSAGDDWIAAVQGLYELSRNPNGANSSVVAANPYRKNLVQPSQLPSEAGKTGWWQTQWGIALGLAAGTAGPVPARSLKDEHSALSAGMAQGEGYLVIAENNDPAQNADPVQLHLIKVSQAPFQGSIKVIKSKNIFDEKLTLHYTGDFGGEPENFSFEWFYQGVTGLVDFPTAAVPDANWKNFQDLRLPAPSSDGMTDITIEGASPLTMSDNWFIARYYYKRAWPALAVPSAIPSPDRYPHDANNWSKWGGVPGKPLATPPVPGKPKLATGWIKRVIAGLNPLDARVTDFRDSATNTTVSMISQLGTRYEGAIALNGDPDNLNSLGLISAYETVLNRGREFSIDATPPQNYGPTNDALLNISSRLATFYLALGNEAYADAVDPTIGFSTTSALGNKAPSVFAFQNMEDSLLEEELALMRGRDDTTTGVSSTPYYNRLPWNFTQGEGQTAYVQNYDVTDKDGDGGLTYKDAALMFPQGHGDAWGHYLQGIGYYYKLLASPDFSWVPRVEFVTVGGNTTMVDYLDERKFASLAAARAQVGAETVDLTYAKYYTANPAGQWQGYKDGYADRAWGVDEWARRAGQGAFFDWVTANAILPAAPQEGETASAQDRTLYQTDPATGALKAQSIPAAGIQQINRSSVPELGTIVSLFQRIQSKMFEVDSGLNPLGLVSGVVPFDIDPAQVSAGKTHFEQIYDRAEKALENAMVVFDYANGYTQRLRENQDSLDKLKSTLDEQELGYKNGLIEIFGHPYKEDVGAGKTYRDGYDGPDLINYQYVDQTELTGNLPGSYKIFTAKISNAASLEAIAGVQLSDGLQSVSYNISDNGNWFVKPAGFTTRPAPGKIQKTLSDLILAQAAYDKSNQKFLGMVSDIDAAKTNLQARYGVLASQVTIRNDNEHTQAGLDVAIDAMHATSIALNRGSQIANGICTIETEAMPKVVGFADDIFSVPRAAMDAVAFGITTGLGLGADAADYAEFDMTAVKQRLQDGVDLKLSISDTNNEVNQMVLDLNNMVADVDQQLLEVYGLKENVQQAVGAYQAAHAEGLRLLAARTALRTKSAATVTEYRYNDLGFRAFRNDAIQKYQAQFDLAAKYVYLAATAYDYETNLMGSSSGAGAKFLSEIARQRTLGVVSNGIPLAGFPGLADVLARLSQNFAVYKTQLGFNNPQTETTPFSLRTELFRIKADASSDLAWQNVLKDHKVADLWQVPEFRRYCRPFAPESAGAQPGIVIKFPTTVTYGKNFFGWPLSGGDSAYSTSNFSTRVRSVGVWFQDYDKAGLSSTPRIYLVPTGADVLRSPTGDGFATREWLVKDQKLPAPFPIGDADLKNPSFIAGNDSLSDELFGIRKVSDFRAYPYSGTFNPTQTSTDSRLIGRSVWNTGWMMIIPASTLLFNKDVGLNTFINSVDDIKMFFQTYAYSGN